jgi:hypothetical protein
VHNRRLCEQGLESIVVNLESGLKARFFALADRRDKTAGGAHFFNVAHERLPWLTRAPGLRDVLVESPPSDTKAAGRGPHYKSVALGPSYRLSRLSASTQEGLAAAKAKSASSKSVPI